MPKVKICSIEGCNNKVLSRELCSSHYQHFYKYGDPLHPIEQRDKALQFFEAAKRYDGDECLLWPYARNKQGYPRINVDKKPYAAHRLMCEHVNGPSPPDNDAAHSCGNGHLGCITKRHLSWKTRIENKADELIHGTRRRGESATSAKLTEKDIAHIRDIRASHTMSELAQMFGVSDSTISRIINRQGWKHVA